MSTRARAEKRAAQLLSSNTAPSLASCLWSVDRACANDSVATRQRLPHELRVDSLTATSTPSTLLEAESPEITLGPHRRTGRVDGPRLAVAPDARHGLLVVRRVPVRI